MAIALRSRFLIGRRCVGCDAAIQADFLEKVAQTLRRTCLGIGNGSEPNVVNHPILLHCTGLKIVSQEGIRFLGQAQRLTRS